MYVWYMYVAKPRDTMAQSMIHPGMGHSWLALPIVGTRQRRRATPTASAMALYILLSEVFRAVMVIRSDVAGQGACGILDVGCAR